MTLRFIFVNYLFTSVVKFSTPHNNYVYRNISFKDVHRTGKVNGFSERPRDIVTKFTYF